ncbi:MFS general substrate transporter, partial [Aureobasidium melanogenum]
MATIEKNDLGDSKLEYVEDLEKTNTTWDDRPTLDPGLDRRITRKFDTHVVPWLFGLWLLAFIDRSNIGNARIDGLATDLKLNGDTFNIALAVFYVPYIMVDVPSNLVLKYFQAGYYLPALIIGWGLVGMCMGFVKSYTGLIVTRFFLGLMEGGLLGGMIIYLAMFYKRHQLMFRIGLFYCAAPLSGAVGGLLATSLAKIQTSNYKGWPFIIFVEGGITVLFGFLTIFFLPHTPAESKFLTEEEKAGAALRMHLDSHGSDAADDVRSEKFSWHWVRMAFLNWNTVLLSLNFFAIITPIYSYSLFLPTIIKSLGYKAVHAQLLTVPPNVGAFLSVLLVTWLSDKYRMRGPFMLAGLVIAIGGYIMLISNNHHTIQYGGTFLVAAGIFPCSPLVMGWLANNLAPHYVRATGTGFQIMIANCAAFIATFTYLSKDAPRYITGHAINIGALYKYAPGIRKWHPPIMIASLGASAILDYNSIRTPLAQPRNAILGQTFSALTGVIIHKLFHLNSDWEDLQWVAGAVACAVSSAIMATTNTVHPPGGATAVLATTNAEIIAMGWIYIPFVLMSSVIMLTLACLINNVQRAYPVYWWTPENLRKETKVEDLEKVSSNNSQQVLSGQSMARTSNADPDSVVISPHHLYIPDSFDLDGDELAVLSRLQARLRWDAAMDERPRAYSNSS